MWNWADPVINTAQWIVGSDPAYAYFNYFFTIVSIFGMMGWGIGLLCRIISRS